MRIVGRLEIRIGGIFVWQFLKTMQITVGKSAAVIKEIIAWHWLKKIATIVGGLLTQTAEISVCHLFM